MRNLSLHARIEILVLSALMLWGCDGSSSYGSKSEAYDLADVARANSVNALVQTEELEKRVASLENELQSLTDTVNKNAVASNANRDIFNANSEIINRALDRLDRIERRIGM